MAQSSQPVACRYLRTGNNEPGENLLLVICFALCVLSVPLAGGRLEALATFSPRHAWAVVGALGMQVGIISLWPGSGAIYLGLHLVSYALLLVFLLSNRKLPGLWIIGMGTFMNFVAIASNGGVMPATAGALAKAGIGYRPASVRQLRSAHGSELCLPRGRFCHSGWVSVRQRVQPR